VSDIKNADEARLVIHGKNHPVIASPKSIKPLEHSLTRLAVSERIFGKVFFYGGDNPRRRTQKKTPSALEYCFDRKEVDIQR